MSNSRLQNAIDSIRETLVRFPLPLLDVLILVGATMSWVDDYRWYVIPALGFPVLIASSLFAERFTGSRGIRFVVAFAPIPLLTLYAFLLPEGHVNFAEGLRFALFCIAAVLAMLALPFVAPRTTASFHRFATTFILRLLLTALFTLLLWGGLSLALLAVDKLFSVAVPSETYVKLIVLLIGFVAAPFLLSSVERDLDVQESEIPKVLRALTLYVLMPILVVYALILYAHAAQQIVNWEWSEGWVARLVAGYAGAGLLTFAILWPHRSDPDNQWIRVFTKWFSLLLPPLSFLLLIAVLRRVSEYGITETRYYGMLIAVWLAVVALYLLFSRKADIRVLALSLAVLALGTSFGPWGASAISVQSQVEQLRSALDSVGALKNGKFASPAAPLDEAALGRRSVYSIVRYLEERDALEHLRPWFTTPPDTIDERAVMVAIGSWTDSPDEGGPKVRPVRTIAIYGPGGETVNVSGYDYYIPLTQSMTSTPVAGDSLTIQVSRGGVHLFLRSRHLLSADLVGRFQNLYRERATNAESDDENSSYESISIPPEDEDRMIVDVDDAATGYRMRVYVRQIAFYESDSPGELQNLTGYVLVAKR